MCMSFGAAGNSTSVNSCAQHKHSSKSSSSSGGGGDNMRVHKRAEPGEKTDMGAGYSIMGWVGT